MNNANAVSRPKRDCACRLYHSTWCGFGCLGYIPPHKNIFQTAFLPSNEQKSSSYLTPVGRYGYGIGFLQLRRNQASRSRNRFQYCTGLLRTDQQGTVLHDRLIHYYFVHIMFRAQIRRLALVVCLVSPD